MQKDKVQFLRERVEKHVGNVILKALKAYATSKNIFALNAGQLRHILLVLEDPKDPAQLRPLANRMKLEAMFDSYLQHFHNFLTTVTTLIDHTRHLMEKKFISAAHRIEYQQMIKSDFTSDPLACFMKDFRHYITHYAVPAALLAMNLQSNVSSVYIDVEQLKASGFEWKELARQFMISHRPKIKVLSLVHNYELKVNGLHERIVRSFMRHYEEQFTECDELIKRLNEDSGPSEALG